MPKGGRKKGSLFRSQTLVDVAFYVPTLNFKKKEREEGDEDPLKGTTRKNHNENEPN
jgi:hypothetical protein